MRRLLACTVLSLASAAAFAGDVHCEFNGDYDFSINERSVIFTRADAAPKAIVMRQGRLFVDGAWVTLSEADSHRIAEFEKGTRAAMPEAQLLGREAAHIAFLALGEVAASFSSDPKAVQAKLATVRSQLDTRLARSVTPTRFDSRDLGDGIGDAVKDVVPSLIGDIVGGAISAAFSGDEARLKRMENLDAQIDAKIQPRAAALERRAESLCTRMVELDRLDNALEYRHHGQPLNLLEADTPHRGDERHASRARE